MKKINSFIATLAVLTLLFFSSITLSFADTVPTLSPSCDSSSSSSEDSACIKKLQRMLDDYRIDLQQKSFKIPEENMGMQMTISLPHRPLLSFHSGTITKDDGDPVNKHTFFEIGSITKSFVSAIVLQLEAEGKLNIHDKITKWLPEYIGTLWQDATIDHLIHMTSGFYNYTDDSLWFGRAINDPGHYWTVDELIDWAYKDRKGKTGPLCVDQPGAYGCPFYVGQPEEPGKEDRWIYSNTNFIILEKIIELVSNKSLATLMQERLFTPLHMHNSKYDPSLIPKTLENFAHGYAVLGDGVFDSSVVSHSVSRGAGGIISNTEDLVKWMRALFRGKVLPAQQFAEMTTMVCYAPNKTLPKPMRCTAGKVITDENSQGAYSSGLGRFNDSSRGVIFFSSGGTVGHRSMFFYFPKTDTMIAIIGNLSPIEFDGYRPLVDKVYKYFYPSAQSIQNLPMLQLEAFSDRM